MRRARAARIESGPFGAMACCGREGKPCMVSNLRAGASSLTGRHAETATEKRRLDPATRLTGLGGPSLVVLHPDPEMLSRSLARRLDGRLGEPPAPSVVRWGSDLDLNPTPRQRGVANRADIDWCRERISRTSQRACRSPSPGQLRCRRSVAQAVSQSRQRRTSLFYTRLCVTPLTSSEPTRRLRPLVAPVGGPRAHLIVDHGNARGSAALPVRAAEVRSRNTVDPDELSCRGAKGFSCPSRARRSQLPPN